MEPAAPVVYTIAASPAASSTAGSSTPPRAVAAAPLMAAQTVKAVSSYEQVPEGGSDTSYTIAVNEPTPASDSRAAGFVDVPGGVKAGTTKVNYQARRQL
jgi:hypothetical protein